MFNLIKKFLDKKKEQKKLRELQKHYAVLHHKMRIQGFRKKAGKLSFSERVLLLQSIIISTNPETELKSVDLNDTEHLKVLDAFHQNNK